MADRAVPLAKIIVFASGEGSLFRSIVEAEKSGKAFFQVTKLVVSRVDCGAAGLAQELSVPVQDSAAFFSETDHEADAFVLAGYLKKIPEDFTASYGDKTLNTHPALLPKFGGQGMYGRRVHEAVVAAGEAESGFTVHLVNENYDEGKILFQHPIPLVEGETAESLEAKIKSAEREIFPKVISEFVSGKLS